MNCQVIRAKYPGYVPAIIKCDASIEMTKKRFLLPESENFGHALHSIRRHVKVKPSEALFFMIDGVMLRTSDNIGNFYSQFVANRTLEDRFLVIDVLKENTFGEVEKRLKDKRICIKDSEETEKTTCKKLGSENLAENRRLWRGRKEA